MSSFKSRLGLLSPVSLDKALLALASLLSLQFVPPKICRFLGFAEYKAGPAAILRTENIGLFPRAEEKETPILTRLIFLPLREEKGRFDAKKDVVCRDESCLFQGRLRIVDPSHPTGSL